MLLTPVQKLSRIKNKPRCKL